jgi:hypothetical protein
MENFLLNFGYLLEIDTKHIEYILIDFDYDNLTLYYAFMVPEIINVKNGNWKYIGTIDDQKTQKLIFQAGQEAISRRFF